MAQSLKVIKNRIRSIQNTEKVTSAMQMISVTKFSRIEKQLYAFRPYFKKLETLFYHLGPTSHPFFQARAVKERIALCVFTSDNGLCSTYNNNVIRLAEEFIGEKGKEKVRLIAIGKKGWRYFNSHGFNILNSYIGLNGKFSEKICDEITRALSELFLSKQVDEVYLGYTRFENALSLKPAIIKFLNLEIAPAEEIDTFGGIQTPPFRAGKDSAAFSINPEQTKGFGPRRRRIDYIFEPSRARVMEELLPKYISFKMRLIFLEAFTSEHAARTVAMKAATENARELLQKLILLRNKVRQANITRDILEIISSAEALKG